MKGDSFGNYPLNRSKGRIMIFLNINSALVFKFLNQQSALKRKGQPSSYPSFIVKP